MKPVALVSMPTALPSFPSFSIALLAATLRREEIPVECFSLHVYFGAVGWRLYQTLGECWNPLFGEWVWAREAWGDFADEQAYLEESWSNVKAFCAMADCEVDDLLHLRREAAPAFIDYCLECADWGSFGLVGFSVVYQQLNASLALAKRLKTLHPDLPIVFGGPAFEDDLGDELMRACPFIDVLHCGDADETLPELVRRLDEGRSLSGLPGLLWRREGQLVSNGRAPNLEELAGTPLPDFEEHLHALELSGYSGWEGRASPRLAVETGRGCWWGARHHCIFCGLNRSGMTFRSLSPDQALERFEAMTRRYGVSFLYATDNIMDPRYATQLFPRLQERCPGLRVHYCLRPRTKREELRVASRGGLRSVQPGVESFSTHLLALLGKRVLAVRNLELVKWCTFYGIEDLYALLLGIPGERAEDYQRQAELFELLHHLQPPTAATRVRADRGSPLFTRPEEFGITELRPQPCYRHIFPEDRCDLRRLSYYFEHHCPGLLENGEYEGFLAAVKRWRDAWDRRPRPRLVARRLGATVVVEDSRGEAPRETILEGDRAHLLELCEEAVPREELAERLELDAERADAALAALVELGLVVELDGRCLSLPLPHEGGA